MPETIDRQLREAEYRIQRTRALVETTNLALYQRLTLEPGDDDARRARLTLATALDQLDAAKRAIDDALSTEAGL